MPAEPRVTEAAPVPADPVVSPADTIRRARNRIAARGQHDLVGLADLADALLAVGERDKAEIARLADRAVCSGCGSDIYDDGGCSHPTCEWGELIPSSELPLALQASCDKLAEVRAERDEEIDELVKAGERDRRQIARLTEALREKARHAGMIAAKCIRDLEFDLAAHYDGRAAAFREAAAVLADEEDALSHSFGEQGIRPEPNHTWPEEDADNG